MASCSGQSLHRVCWLLHFLWCMISLRPCAGEISSDSETSGHVCLLQTSTQLQRSPSAADSANLAEKGAPKRYILFAQHKAGYELCDESARIMHEEMAAEAGLSFGVNLDMAWALSSPEMQSEWDPEKQTGIHMRQTPACFLHVVRNPFEMLVSGYLYHMSQSEPWLGNTFENVDTLLKEKFEEPFCVRHPLEGVSQVFRSSLSGSMSAWLPDAEANETYSQYLQRADLDAGLIAEFIWASNTSLASVLFTDGFLAESQACSINMCINEFYENCNATWERIFLTWQVPEHHHDRLLRAATQSCPTTSLNAVTHSSNYQTEKKALAHVPERDMVKRLRELDRTLFNGEIAALEKHSECPARGKYM